MASRETPSQRRPILQHAGRDAPRQLVHQLGGSRGDGRRRRALAIRTRRAPRAAHARAVRLRRARARLGVCFQVSKIKKRRAREGSPPASRATGRRPPPSPRFRSARASTTSALSSWTAPGPEVACSASASAVSRAASSSSRRIRRLSSISRRRARVRLSTRALLRADALRRPELAEQIQHERGRALARGGGGGGGARGGPPGSHRGRRRAARRAATRGTRPGGIRAEKARRARASARACPPSTPGCPVRPRRSPTST